MSAAADPPAPIPHKPSRAETARANGALSRGPTTEGGKARSSMNGLVHGLRARRHLAVPALGEDAAEAEAHTAAVRAELGAGGPVARHLAETVACSMLRAARAERLEGELLAGLGEDGRSVAAALHADRDARATLALLQRYRREADAELRRSLDSLVRLHRARTEDLLPGGEEAERAQAMLDETAAGLPAPSEPRIEKIVAAEQVGRPVNDDAASPSAARREGTGEQLLRRYRELPEDSAAAYWRTLTGKNRAKMIAAAEAGAGTARGAAGGPRVANPPSLAD